MSLVREYEEPEMNKQLVLILVVMDVSCEKNNLQGAREMTKS